MKHKFTFPILAVTIVTSLVAGLSSCDKITVDDDITDPVYENHINLTGQSNFRDLGGYVGANDKRIVYHKLFRSGDLSKLTTADLDTVANLNIAQVIDLRTTSEMTSSPDKLPAGVVSYHLPLIADVTGGTGSTATLMAEIISGQVSAESYMLPIYSTIDSLKIANWKNIFAYLQTGKTTLWHCTAGKDRAGMTTALVLCSLGVDSTTIVNDFMASNTYLYNSIQATVTAMNTAYGAGAGDKLIPLLGVEESYILAFFTAVNTKYGSMNNFLTALGVDKAKMQSLFLEK